VYDGIQAIGEIRGRQTTTLLTGLVIDEMIARYTEQGSRVFLTDALGSVIAQARGDQSLLNRYAYSPYGEANAAGDDDGNSSEYTARENDGTGLYFYRARYYDPVLKRFIAEDPIGLEGGPNSYAYVSANPIGFADPLGLLFGVDAGESYGDSAAQHWADLHVRTGNFLYAIPGAMASLWTPCTSNQTFLGLLPPAAGGKVLPAAVKLLSNRVKGAIGETTSVLYNWLGGNTLIGRQIRIPGMRAIADSAWKGYDGAIYYVESKFGTSTLSKAQRVARDALGRAYHVERWGYDWVGRVGASIGLGVGAVGASLCSCR
jgi:RHS repeat-associated protein